MESTKAIASPAQTDGASTIWGKIRGFVLRRRVRITAIVFFLLILEDVVDRVDPHNLANIGDVKVLVGLGLVLCGLGLRSWAAGTLHKRTQLTTSGPYGLVRHPLYIGSFMMMLGFCTLVDDAENIWFVVGPILLMYVLRALHEEKTLSGAFPEQWNDYIRSVPRFFPRRWPKELFADWKLSQWIKNREYQAVSAVLLGLVALQLWQMMLA